MELDDERPRLTNRLLDLGERAIADLKVYDSRGMAHRGRAELKVTMFVDNREVLANRQFPNDRVLGLTKSELNNVVNIASKISKPTRQTSGQVLIEQQLQFARSSHFICWSAAKA
jgi:hypothetical protein